MKKIIILIIIVMNVCFAAWTDSNDPSDQQIIDIGLGK